MLPATLAAAPLIRSNLAATCVPSASRTGVWFRKTGRACGRGLRGDPAGESVLDRVAGVGVEGLGADPQDGRAEAAFGVAGEHRVEEAERGAVLLQEQVG